MMDTECGKEDRATTRTQIRVEVVVRQKQRKFILGMKSWKTGELPVNSIVVVSKTKGIGKGEDSRTSSV